MKGDRYEMDGASLTMAEIARLVPCMSIQAVKNAVARGCKSRTELLRQDFRRASRKVKPRGIYYGAPLR